MNEMKQLKMIIFAISGLGFIFFTINQFLNQALLVELLEITGQETIMIQLNYISMLTIGVFLLIFALNEFLSRNWEIE
jgi:hypothetical protein